jgi:hypothetical protein
MPFPQHDPLAHKHLFHNLLFECVGEYFRATYTLALFPLTPMSSDTTLVLTTLHPKLDGYFSLFLEVYELDQDLDLSSNSFKLTFQRMLHLSISGPSMMVFEHLWDYFHLENSTNGFF